MIAEPFKPSDTVNSFLEKKNRYCFRAGSAEPGAKPVPCLVQVGCGVELSRPLSGTASDETCRCIFLEFDAIKMNQEKAESVVHFSYAW
jgi:hypothetical protein